MNGELDFFSGDWELLVSLKMTGITCGNQEDGMVFPGFVPFTACHASVVLPVMNLQVRLTIAKPASVFVSIQNLKS